MNRFSTILMLLAMMLVLLSPSTSAREIIVEKGEINGAPFRIQIPSEWNHGMVMYAHGYLPRGMPWTPLGSDLCATFLDRGFAVVESGYSRQGWALEEALPEIEALRRYFVKKRGKPESAYIAGHSMGGILSLAVVETYPDAYDGALPMCGPLVPAVVFIKDPVFDMLVTFEAIFGKALPDEMKPVVEAPFLLKKPVQEALESDPEAAERFSLRWDVRREDLPVIIEFYHLFYREMRDRAGGNPVDNRNTVYSGFGSNIELNETVPRYAANPKALEYLRKHYTTTGEVSVPVLAVHTSYDAGVPPRLANAYDVTASLNGNEKCFVHMYVEAEGHCNISPDLTGKAFDRLRKWASDGIRPEAGCLR